MSNAKNKVMITTAWLNINTACNNRCAWCYRRDDLALPAKQMPFTMAEQMVDFFSELGVQSCIFIGGEPTLYHQLPALISRAKKGKIGETTIVTNGRLLHSRKLVDNYVEAGLDVFSVTIHSAKREIHDNIAGVSSWEQTVAGIKNIVAAGKKCSLNVVVGDQNITSTRDSLVTLLGLGVDQIILSCALPCINGLSVDGTYALDPRRFATLIEEMVDLSNKVVVLHELPLCLISRPTFLRMTKSGRLGYGCHIGIGRGLIIDVNGAIIPCSSFANCTIAEMFRGGKLIYTPEEFVKAWQQDEVFLNLRREANVMRSDICTKCGLWSICNCGCPLTWGHFDPADYINNSLYGISAEEVYSWSKTEHNP